MSAIYIELLTECIKRLPRLTYFYRICKCQLSWASALNCTVAPRKELACNNKNNCNENHSTLFTDSLSSGSDEEIFGSPSFSCSASYQKRGEQVIILSVHRKCESGKQRRKLSKTSMLMDAQDNKNPSSIITKCVCIHKDASFSLGLMCKLGTSTATICKISSACSSGGLTHPGKHHVES